MRKLNIKINFSFTLYLFVAVTAHLNAQGSWVKIDSPTNQFLKSVYFVDSLYGWAVGDSGTIIHTDNGGTDWNFQDSNTKNEIVDVFFLNRYLGWASAWNSSNFPYGTVLLKTTDGGQNWMGETYREENLFMNCILFLDSLNGWMGGDPHAIVRTTDGGITWQQAEIDSVNLAFFPVFSIQFFNDQFGYASGGALDIAGVTWRTTNGGDKWFPIDTSDAPADPIHEIHTFDSINVLGIGGDPEFFGVQIIRTSDGGLNWEYNDLGMQGVAFDLDFRNNYEVWAPLGPQQKFVLSIDSGKTWNQISTPDSSAIYDVIFPDSLHGFAVGEQGAILRYIPPIINNLGGESRTSFEKFILYQNYPNPFNPTTTIEFRLSDLPVGKRGFEFVSLKVYDVLGNEVATLINEEELQSGSHKVEFDASGLSSGLYFYQIKFYNYGENNSSVATKKMILLK